MAGWRRIVALVLAAWYAWGVRSRPPGPAWPVRRSLVFALGTALLIWTTNGFFEAYAPDGDPAKLADALGERF